MENDALGQFIKETSAPCIALAAWLSTDRNTRAQRRPLLESAVNWDGISLARTSSGEPTYDETIGLLASLLFKYREVLEGVAQATGKTMTDLNRGIEERYAEMSVRKPPQN